MNQALWPQSVKVCLVGKKHLTERLWQLLGIRVEIFKVMWQPVAQETSHRLRQTLETLIL